MRKDTLIKLMCETCGSDLGTTIKLGQLAEQLAGLGKTATEKVELDEKIRLGMCDKCKAELADGCVFFCDKNQRVIKVKKEAAAEKIDAAYIGKVVMIPVAAMNYLVQTWAQDQIRNHKPEDIKPDGENTSP